MSRRSIRLAQNFLTNRRLAASIVAQARLDQSDVVYEIGPGGGLLTRELARAAGHVVALEIDPTLCARLRARLRDLDNVELHCRDFLRHRIRARRYKVVASIPYNRTAAILRKLLERPDPPDAAWLIVQREAARRYAGVPRERQCSLLLKPWFALGIVRRLPRTDFHPMPSVDSVLLRIVRRAEPLVSRRDATSYRQFVRLGFGPRGTLRRNLRGVFTPRQWHRLARDLVFAPRASPTELTFAQWLGLFEFLAERGRRRRAPLDSPAGMG
jgi:23S rRNA (adenine-N6)-dimethyltransferase